MKESELREFCEKHRAVPIIVHFHAGGTLRIPEWIYFKGGIEPLDATFSSLGHLEPGLISSLTVEGD